MNLRDYLHKNNIRKKEFALQLGYNYAFVCRVSEFGQRPGKRFAKAIEDATNGEVTVKELLNAKYKKHQ
jgi:DNA-binding transcriptional regulator YdaS (Cro superfamily)